MNSGVLYLEDGPQITIELCRPEKGNAFDKHMAAEIGWAFRRANECSGARFVLLRGQGRHFCTGADLNWMAKAGTLTAEENTADAQAIADMYTAMAQCEVPILARVHGKVRGGGVGLTAASDIVVCHETTTFALPEARMALVTGILTPVVQDKIGRSRFLYYAMTGFEMSAAEARECGLVHFQGREDEVENFLNRCRESIELNDAMAVRGIKAMAGARDVQPRRWLEWTAEARGSGEAQRRMNAFLKGDGKK